MIRPARSDDLDQLHDIERAAGDSFRALGMDAVADDEPPSHAALTGYMEQGRAWVVADDVDHPLGYLLVDVVDRTAHIEQVSVHPAAAGRALGRALIGRAEDWARAEGLSALTLTTYVDVPWNAPYYRRLGFRDVPESALGDGLRRVRAHERESGLDRWPRTAMTRPLPPDPVVDRPG